MEKETAPGFQARLQKLIEFWTLYRAVPDEGFAESFARFLGMRLDDLRSLRETDVTAELRAKLRVAVGDEWDRWLAEGEGEDPGTIENRTTAQHTRDLHAELAREERQETVGQRVRQAMEDAKINQAELARRIGKTPGYVSTLLNSDQVPRADVMVTIANALDVDVARLLTARPSPEIDDAAERMVRRERYEELRVTEARERSERAHRAVMGTALFRKQSTKLRQIFESVRLPRGDIETWTRVLLRLIDDERDGVPRQIASEPSKDDLAPAPRRGPRPGQRSDESILDDDPTLEK